MKSVFLILNFLSFFAFANLSGDWVGWGQWAYQDSAINCNQMQMTWSETKTQIEITKGIFDCDILAMHLGKTVWTKKMEIYWMKRILLLALTMQKI